jgi:hypothetical protein
VSSIKEFLFDIYRFYYRITASLRAKPDFLIIGVQKVEQHPFSIISGNIRKSNFREIRKSTF